ncbi:MAG: long-chain fatty acid--CoA ligase [Deltaproteobacteria bacterium]|nr:long-chain fatty acid--CoA ligase [Deltaproteobacteria bacterium]
MDVTPLLELRTAPAIFFEEAKKRGAAPRFMVPQGSDYRAVSWRDVADQVRELGLYLIELGLEPTDRGAIFAPNRVEWMSAALAIQAVGGVMVPVYPSCTSEQAAYVLTHSDAKVVFVDTELLLSKVLARLKSLTDLRAVVMLGSVDVAKAMALVPEAERPSLAGLEGKLISLEAAQRRGRRRSLAEFARRLASVSLDQVGLMLYTSGTSGPPKGVPLTHKNVGVNGRDWLQINGPLLSTDGDVDLLWLPMSHIFGFGEACLGNQLGFVSYLSDPFRVLDHMSKVRPTVFMSVPSHWEKIATEVAKGTTPEQRKELLDQRTGGRLKFCLSGGAGLKQRVKETFHEAGVLIIEGYGLTEASPTITLNRPDAFRFDTVGKPLPSVEVKLAEDGEIFARGDSIFSGYHKDPEGTRAVLTEDGWLKTGDIGRFTEDGFLQIIDRKKDILVTAGGKNVAPANIELQFKDDPVIGHVVVYGDARKFLVAGIWLHPGIDAARELIEAKVQAVNATLASYETIKKFKLFPGSLSVENGFLTPTLKVKRKRVYEDFGAALEALYEAP